MKYRTRFEFVDVFALIGNSLSISGAVRVPVKCWRATFILRNTTRGAARSPIIDGVSFAPVVGEGTANLPSNMSFVVGGVFDANGVPVLIDQQITLSAPADDVPLILVLEHIEPWHE